MQPVPSNWFEDFFSGIVVEMWAGAVPEEMTGREVDFIRKSIGVDHPARLLDVPCGAGRHALALEAEGYRVTGADISAEFLDVARARAAEKNLAVAWRQSPMRDIPWRDEFDGAYCFGNCFGYDDDEGN